MQKYLCSKKQTFKNMQKNATAQITLTDDTHTLIAFKYVHFTGKATNYFYYPVKWNFTCTLSINKKKSAFSVHTLPHFYHKPW